MLGRVTGAGLTQEKIVLLIAIVLFCVFSIFLRGFLSPNNILTLLRSVSTLGILGVGMAIVVIGRGIDLTIVAIYAMSAAWDSPGVSTMTVWSVRATWIDWVFR